jgi:hypothetical protein
MEAAVVTRPTSRTSGLGASSTTALFFGGTISDEAQRIQYFLVGRLDLLHFGQTLMGHTY